VTCVVYFLLPVKIKHYAILALNLLFSLSFDGVLFVYAIITIISTCVAGVLIEQNYNTCKAIVAAETDITRERRNEIRLQYEQKAKILLISTLILNFGIWSVLKYTNFIIENINKLRLAMEMNECRYLELILPLGISFYTFQAMGYLIDVYRKKYAPEHSIVKIATFVTFFAHIMQGPFSRYDTLAPSLFADNKFSYDRMCEGCRRILWGLTKKMLIADKLGIAVDYYFANLRDYSGIYLCTAGLLYAFQLYADFSGYMDMACGACHIMGINLDENFERPFLAISVEEYWRRWHITLGTWFRDYVFYPVSFGKTAQKIGKASRKRYGARMGKLVPSYLALIFVWTITGLWHGAAWKYVVWGLLNLLIIVFSMQMEPAYDKIKCAIHADKHPGLWKLFMIVRTFIIISFLRVMSRCTDLKECMWMYANTFKRANNIPLSVDSLFPSMRTTEVMAAVFLCIVLMAVDLLEENDIWNTVKEKTPGIMRNVAYTGLILMLVLWAGGSNDLTSGFMYAVF